jgi:hypothetical protein
MTITTIRRRRAARVAIGVALTASAIAASGAVNTSSGQSGSAPGVTYGGQKNADWSWFRLDASRRVVAAAQIPVAISGARCSNHRGYFTAFYFGSEDYRTIAVAADGSFSKEATDRYRDRGNLYRETAKLSGRVTDSRVSATISGTVRVVKASGAVVRCTFGPQPFAAFN